MTDQRGVTHYDQMPIPPVEAHTRYFDAGVLRIGVEYRLLNDAIAAASAIEKARGDSSGADSFDDCGVSLHVFGQSDGESHEYLRFDCFEEDPHYHYVDWKNHTNQMVHIDPDAQGDALAWSIDCLRNRLAQMLERAGAHEVVSALDLSLVESVLPAIEDEAQRARVHHDKDAIGQAALRGGQR